MASLEGKRAIVTGASSGIGAATTAALRAAGARSTPAPGSEGNLDVMERASTRGFVDAALAELGGLDILVNNAGLSRGRDPVWDSLDEDEHEVVVTNVLGLMRMTRLCIPALIESGDGHVVNIGSVAGIWAYANGSSYVASKFAVHGYTRALREDLFGKPVRVTNIAGGPRRDRTSRTVRFKGDEQKAAAVYANVGLGGPLRPRTSPSASSSRSRGRRTSHRRDAGPRARPDLWPNGLASRLARSACPSSGAGRATTARTARRRRRRPPRRRHRRARRRRTRSRRARLERAGPHVELALQRGRGAPRRRRGRRSGRAPAGPAARARIASAVACQALDVDVRRRRDGQHVGRAGQPDARGVAGEHRPVAGVADVVRGVADVGNASQPSTSPAAIRTFASGTGASSPHSASNASP